MACASRCTDANPSPQGRSGFAAVERGKHHLHTAVWYTPFLPCSSFLQSHPTLQYFSCTEFRRFFFQTRFSCTSLILTSVKRWNILFSRFSEQFSRRMLRRGVEMSFGQKTVLARWRATFGNSCQWAGSHCPWKKHSVSSGTLIVCIRYAVVVSVHLTWPLASSGLHTGLGHCI